MKIRSPPIPGLSPLIVNLCKVYNGGLPHDTEMVDDDYDDEEDAYYELEEEEEDEDGDDEDEVEDDDDEGFQMVDVDMGSFY
ncbi:hypothetical protein PVAP13_5KG239107 [Panicum virgatum]|uniref:Uncharacterized protein n=1 Tax=Panicum virgatum TaxID=38727 RepID=A0A8T0SGW6_PANVG|nr:hypothetical protein PVAP13_5KG239107 [Panicum virgatum]